MYLGNPNEDRVFDTSEDGRWRYCVSLSPYGEFTHVSFVNGIYTKKGGKHVDYILK